MKAHQQRCDTFRQLHQAHGFVMPNPWDAGSARVLEQMGFKALATTSAGFAWTQGMADNQITLEQALMHLRDIVAAVSIPVNADFEGGFATDPARVAENVALAVATGIAGLSIEDATGDADHPLHDFDLAVTRIKAARSAIDETKRGVLLTGRSEGFICGRPDIAETIRRLQAYAEAGADCLYAPGVRKREDIAAIVAAVSPKPVNLLINAPYITVSEATHLGVRRISVGGALARAAWAGFLSAAKEIWEAGTFGCLEELPNVDAMFSGR